MLEIADIDHTIEQDGVLDVVGNRRGVDNRGRGRGRDLQILGRRTPAVGRLVFFDAFNLSGEEHRLSLVSLSPRDKECPVCKRWPAASLGRGTDA